MSDQILNSISKSFAVALASLNEGLANASKEISGLREKVASKQTQNGLLNTALIDAKSELDLKRAETAKSYAQQQELEKELAEYTNRLDVAKQQKTANDERATKLERQVVDITDLKHKTAMAEQERAKIHEQLSNLRAALRALTTPVKATAKKVIDHAVVSEIKENTSEDEDSTFISAMDASCAVETVAPLSLLPPLPESESECEPEDEDSTFTSAMDASCAVETVAPLPPLPPLHEPEPEPQPEPQSVPVDSRYKTRLCLFYKRGHCERGAKCMFAHGTEELRFDPGKYHKQVSAVAAMGFDVDIAVIGALFQEYRGNTERVLSQLMK